MNLDINEELEVIAPETLHSIEITDGKIEKIGQAIRIEGKNIILHFDSLCKRVEK